MTNTTLNSLPFWLQTNYIAVLIGIMALLTISALWRERRRKQQYRMFGRKFHFRFVDLSKNQKHSRAFPIQRTAPVIGPTPKDRGLIGKLQQLSRRIGKTSKPPPFGWPPTELFTQGDRYPVRYYLERHDSNRQTYIFTHTFATGSGKNRSRSQQTVIVFKSEPLELPDFSLTPERALHRLASVFGYQDIDLADSPDFSKKYLLRGKSEEALRHFFTRDLCRQMLRNPLKFRIEAHGPWMAFFYPRKRISANRLHSTLEACINAHTVLAATR